MLGGIGNEALRETAKPVARVECVRLFGRMPWDEASPVLTQLIASGNDLVRTAAIRALAGFRQPEVVRLLLAPGVWAGASPTHRDLLLSELLANPAHLAGLLDAVEDGRLPADAIAAGRRAVFAKDKTLRARAAKLLGF
jgi:HEAT repeat protein